MQRLSLHILIGLSWTMKIQPSGNSKGLTFGQAADPLQTDQMPNWGAKRARTARYEVVEVIPTSSVHEQNNLCNICRPECSHWVSLSKSKRKLEIKKWYLKNKTKEQRSAYDSRQKMLKKEWYANLTKLQKKGIRERALFHRKERLNRMKPEQRKAFWKKNREYSSTKKIPK